MDEATRTESRFLLATLILFALLGFLVVRHFLFYILFGVMLTFAFLPLHRRIRKHIRSPATAAAVTMVLAGVVVVGPLVATGMLVFQDTVSFVRTYDPDRLNETIQPILSAFGIEPRAGASELETQPSAVANWLGDQLRDMAARLGGSLVDILPHLALGLFVAAFVCYYGFLDGEAFYRRLRDSLPLPERVEEDVFSRVRDVTRAVFIGTILVAFLSAVLGTATFLAFGVPNAVFWGFIMLILGILPVVGAPFIWIPVGLWQFIDGHPRAGLAILLINSIVGFGYIEHVLRPRVIGRMGRVHPVLVLVGAFGGIEVFGILGFAVGPLVLAILLAIIESYTQSHPRWIARARTPPAAPIPPLDPPPSG